MNLFTSFFKIIAAAVFLMLLSMNGHAQTDTAKKIQRIGQDTKQQAMNMDAVYNRPFLSAAKLPVAIGGYLEVNTEYASTDGITDGMAFQARRFTLFFSSTITKRIKFLSELEFEGGTREINIEFAAMDIEFHPLLNLRGGIIMNPIGAFNQNHDGPRWDFIDRPVSATSIIPTTLSNAGSGLHGKYYVRQWTLGYEAYLSNGFDGQIISNAEGRTSLAAGKHNSFRFEESHSGLPMFTGKVAVRKRKIGELGFSCMSGVFNKWMDDGLVLDKKRTASVLAVDINTAMFNDRLSIVGEAAKVFVDVPAAYSQQYGTRQFGSFVDIVATVLDRRMMGWEGAKLNLGARLEYVDYNLGKFEETGEKISDDFWAIVPSVAFRPAGPTVIRFNYRFEQQTDLLGNLPALTGVIQFGFSTYF
ncbi:MAG: hypothetical protein WD077_04625 [Bacteroidia bacterium]